MNTTIVLFHTDTGSAEKISSIFNYGKKKPSKICSEYKHSKNKQGATYGTNGDLNKSLQTTQHRQSDWRDILLYFHSMSYHTILIKGLATLQTTPFYQNFYKINNSTTVSEANQKNRATRLDFTPKLSSFRFLTDSSNSYRWTNSYRKRERAFWHTEIQLTEPPNGNTR